MNSSRRTTSKKHQEKPQTSLLRALKQLRRRRIRLRTSKIHDSRRRQSGSTLSVGCSWQRTRTSTNWLTGSRSWFRWSPDALLPEFGPNNKVLIGRKRRRRRGFVGENGTTLLAGRFASRFKQNRVVQTHEKKASWKKATTCFSSSSTPKDRPQERMENTERERV